MSGPDREGTVAAIGEEYRIAGYGLAGVRLHPAADPEAVRSAWARLDSRVALVLLTPAAAGALASSADASAPRGAGVPGTAAGAEAGPLTVVLP